MTKLLPTLLAVVIAASACASADVVSVAAGEPGEPMDCTADMDLIISAMQSGLPTYDYEGAPNLALLVERTAVVFGPLTSISRDSSGEGGTVFSGGFEVIGGGLDTTDEGFVEAFSAFSSTSGGKDVLEDGMSLSGVNVVAFVVPEPAAPGGYSVDIQGLAVACADGPVFEVIEPLPTDAPHSSITELVGAVYEVGDGEGAPENAPAITLDQDELRPGSAFVATFEEDFSRGGYYLLAPITEDGTVGEPEFLLESHHNPGTPQVFPITNGEWGVNDYGVDGTEPDQLLLPEAISPGEWQLCTANARQTACVALTITT